MEARKNAIKRICVLQKILQNLTSIAIIEGCLQRSFEVDRMRSYWVHPVNQMRFVQGDGIQLYEELRELGDAEFFRYTRLTIPQFDILLDLTRENLTKIMTRPDVILPHARLFMTLRSLATGDNYDSVHFSHRVGRSTARQIIIETSEVIVEALKDTTFPPYTKERWIEISNRFKNRTNFPNVLGAIDGRQCDFKAPPNSGSSYYNYKHRFSMVLLAICDADLRFIYASVGAMGSSSDSSVFRDCAFGKMLAENRLDIPPPAFVNESEREFPFTFIADAAFPLRTNIMTPYSRRGVLTAEEYHYNKELSRGRITVENGFGILAARWKILGKKSEMQPESFEKIILACVTLHNFIISHRTDLYIPENFVDRESSNGEIIPGDYRNLLPNDGNRLIGNQSTSRSMINIAIQQREAVKDYLYENH